MTTLAALDTDTILNYVEKSESLFEVTLSKTGATTYAVSEPKIGDSVHKVELFGRITWLVEKDCEGVAFK